MVCCLWRVPLLVWHPPHSNSHPSKLLAGTVTNSGSNWWGCVSYLSPVTPMGLRLLTEASKGVGSHESPDAVPRGMQSFWTSCAEVSSSRGSNSKPCIPWFRAVGPETHRVLGKYGRLPAAEPILQPLGPCSSAAAGSAVSLSTSPLPVTLWKRHQAQKPVAFYKPALESA